MNMSKIWLEKFVYFYNKISHYGEIICFPIVVLAMRIWIARVFFYSGLTKLDSWQTTLYLFRNEYKVPFLPADVAAYLTVFFELALPALIVIGLATRLATIPLIVMAVVIYSIFHMQNEEALWLFLLFTLLFYGPGKFSLDYWIKKRISSKTY